MGKVKLAICIGDAEYQARFIRCLMNHYKDRFALHGFEKVSQIEEPESFGGYILGKSMVTETDFPMLDLSKALLLDEENRYMGVNRIIEELEKNMDFSQVGSNGKKDRSCRLIGIHSFDVPQLQMPFAAVLADIYGEHRKVVLLDFQRNSGLEEVADREETTLGMEEFMAAVTDEGDRRIFCQTMLGHLGTWDFINPIRNSNCLQEQTEELSERMISMLTGEMGYEIVVINLGDPFVDFAMECQDIYFLHGRGTAEGWREKSYIKEMERRGKHEIFNRVTRVEVPAISGADRDWKELAEKWKWNQVGDLLRKVAWEVCEDG